MRGSGPLAVIAGTVLLPVLLLIARQAVADDKTVGSVKKVFGDAAIVRDGQRTTALPGFRLRFAAKVTE